VFGTIVWWAVAIGIGLVIFRLGFGMLRSLAAPIPEPPPPGELRKVSVRYRCSICGMELKMTLAPDQDPEPPKHCLEEMTIMAPLYD
jgi:hypothetical protein